jgi:hypothetical protein
MFNIFGKKKSPKPYTEIMLGVAVEQGILNRVEGFPLVPEISIREAENTAIILNSDYMKQIPIDDFDEGVSSAMQFSFAFGVVMAALWHSNFQSFKQYTFDTKPHEVEQAMLILEISPLQYATLIVAFFNAFSKEEKQRKSPDIRTETFLAVSTLQTVGAAVYLRKIGFR